MEVDFMRAAVLARMLVRPEVLTAAAAIALEAGMEIGSATACASAAEPARVGGPASRQAVRQRMARLFPCSARVCPPGGKSGQGISEKCQAGGTGALASRACEQGVAIGGELAEIARRNLRDGGIRDGQSGFTGSPIAIQGRSIEAVRDHRQPADDNDVMILS